MQSAGQFLDLMQKVRRPLMSIVCGAVAKGKTLLGYGNTGSPDTIETISDKILHYHPIDDFVFVCVAEKAAGTRVPYGFLRNIGGSFQEELLSYYQTDDYLSMQQVLQPFLNEQIEEVNAAERAQVERIRNTLASVHQAAVENMNVLLENGNQMKEINLMAMDLTQNAALFNKEARGTRCRMKWKNIKIQIVGGVVLIALIIVIICVTTGGGSGEDDNEDPGKKPVDDGGKKPPSKPVADPNNDTPAEGGAEEEVAEPVQLLFNIMQRSFSMAKKSFMGAYKEYMRGSGAYVEEVLGGEEEDVVVL